MHCVTVQKLSSLLTRLNLETRHCHADVDDLWLALTSPTVTVADYTKALVRSYGLIAPFEGACKYTPGLARVVDFRYFLRAGLIQRLIITRIPVLLGDGIPLFGSLPHDVRLRHIATRSYPSGLVQTEYEVVV